MSGKPLSDSHFAMADLETANFSASCSCDKPVFFLAYLIFSPSVISITSGSML
jgi:hypothetical protein